MSTASDIRDEGLDLLLELDAEALTIPGRNNAAVSAIVNRLPLLLPMADPRTFHFAPSEQSTIWIKRAAVSPLPRTGERLLDSFGHTHDVKKVEVIGDVIQLSCTVTPGTIGQ